MPASTLLQICEKPTCTANTLLQTLGSICVNLLHLCVCVCGQFRFIIFSLEPCACPCIVICFCAVHLVKVDCPKASKVMNPWVPCLPMASCCWWQPLTAQQKGTQCRNMRCKGSHVVFYHSYKTSVTRSRFRAGEFFFRVQAKRRRCHGAHLLAGSLLTQRILLRLKIVDNYRMMVPVDE